MNINNTNVARRKPEQDRSRRRVEAILAAARLLIAERGIDPLTMTNVAAEAGMGLTALYRYFPNKTSIIRELATRMLDQDKAGLLSEVMALNVSVQDLVTFATRQYVKLHRQEPYRISLRTAIQSDTELLQIDIRDTRESAKILADKICTLADKEASITIERFVLMYLTLLNATIQLMAQTHNPDEAEWFIDRFMSMSILQLHTELEAVR